MWKGPFWEGVWPCLDPWDSVRLRSASAYWNVPEKYGPHGELFFFFIKKELVVASKEVSSKPFISAETLKAYALIGLHLLAAEGEAGSSDGSALSRGLGALASSLELPHGRGPSLPRSEGCLLGKLRVTGLPLYTVITVPERSLAEPSHQQSLSLPPWTGCDN